MLKYNPTNAKFYYSVIIVVILNHYKNVVFLVFDCLRHIELIYVTTKRGRLTCLPRFCQNSCKDIL